MRIGDVSITPQVTFLDTKANIEAYPDPQEGMEALSTDTHEKGFYNGSAWVWGGGGGTPGGSDTQIQFNDGGAFGGAELEYIGGATSTTMHVPDQTAVDTDGNDFILQAANGDGVGNGGHIYIKGGDSPTENGNGGNIYLSPGAGDSDGFLYFVKGKIQSPDTGMFLRLYAGNNPLASGGTVTIYGGDSLAGGNGDGGDIFMEPGAKDAGGARNGFFGIKDALSSLYALFDTTLISAVNKIFTFPDKSGTFAMLDDIPDAASAPVFLTDVDSPYTVLSTDGTILCDASGGAITCTLPAATGSGKSYNIKKIDSSANTVTVDGDGAETIDSAANFIISSQYESVTVQDCAAGVWFII